MAAVAPTAAVTVTIPSAVADEDELEYEIPRYLRYYRSGRVDRLSGTVTVPASLDPATGVDSRDVVVDPVTGVSARLYLPISLPSRLPILLYFHGGGFCIESAASPAYHHHLNSLSALAPLLAVSLNYRLAPEHRLPAAYKDAWAGLLWVLSRADPWVARYGDPSRMFVAGDSAGANIAHHVGMRAGPGVIKGVALVHPFFWGSAPVGSEPADLEFRAGMNRRWWFTFPGAEGLDDPRWNPTGEAAPSLKGLGCERVLVAVAEQDFLKHRGRHYYEKLVGCGWEGAAELVETPAQGHVFHLQDPDSNASVKMNQILANFFACDP